MACPPTADPYTCWYTPGVKGGGGTRNTMQVKVSKSLSSSGRELVRNNILHSHWANSVISVYPMLYRLWLYKYSPLRMFILYLSDNSASVLTGLVQYKVFIDDEGSLHWAILINLILNLLLICLHAVRSLTCNTLRVRILCCVCCMCSPSFKLGSCYKTSSFSLPDI